MNQKLVKYIIYYVVVVGLIFGSIALFKAHPEVQLAFWIPGVMIIVYSVIRDDFMRQRQSRHH
jgi:hypothetical protein